MNLICRLLGHRLHTLGDILFCVRCWVKIDDRGVEWPTRRICGHIPEKGPTIFSKYTVEEGLPADRTPGFSPPGAAPEAASTDAIKEPPAEPHANGTLTAINGTISNSLIVTDESPKWWNENPDKVGTFIVSKSGLTAQIIARTCKCGCGGLTRYTWLRGHNLNRGK